MRYCHSVILLPCWFFLIGVWAHENTLGRHGRPKRVLAGHELGQNERDEAPFSSIHYYTWIGKAHDYIPGGAPLWRRVFLFLSPYNWFLTHPGRLKCGGALIHPKIVQTACHCTVTFEKINRRELRWGGYTLRSEWEEQMVIFMGKSDVWSFRYPVKTSRFYAHQDCQKLLFPPYFIKYDFGWILLQDEVPTSTGVSENHWGPIDYAYPYKKSALQELHDRVVAERHVCLLIGHGSTKYGQPSVSRFLKYGWIQVLDYTHCYDVLWKSHHLEYLGGPTYDVVVSWVCTTPLHPLHNPPYLSANHLPGDSGGPVTCNNNYLFLVSSRTKFISRPRAGFRNMSREAALVYSPEANTVENRRNFLMFVFSRFLFDIREPGGLRFLKDRNSSTLSFTNVQYSSSSRCFHPLHFVKLAAIVVWFKRNARQHFNFD